MNKQTLLFWVNILMFIDFIVVAFSGFGRVRNIHFQAASLLIVLLVLHLILNWAWIKSKFGKK
jgi:hypothetical protein